MHIFKLSEWNSPGEFWCCFEKEEGVLHRSNQWWVPAILLNMKKDEYIKWLIDNYKPTEIWISNGNVHYRWDKNHYSDMHKFVLYINKKAREKNFLV